ncbi:hypothetical protein [Deinococcus wulumuqiensis]|uniref:Uncharacterized protein n=1 Tax=Deinococcus wulumuqiensis TaxID=980427 RepID=A0AAV4K6C8_9DEIO|nr:hypothetical protein [Deinococcus wulumuqiensis]QII20012.1 hypothetical protein G6R31_04000 [Deinococcus wulumuqiensis R12]GGI86953.1 hypothetical protein GCM10010914_21740 [Deinococcus wulumuqiensis]GGP29947.1 hypothetical protein GCM10008021_15980 [Deinococcus wulumuqiensis]
MQNTAFAGAAAPRLYVLHHLEWNIEVGRPFIAPPAELPERLLGFARYGLTADARAELSGCLSEMGGTGTHSARTCCWQLISEPLGVRG